MLFNNEVLEFVNHAKLSFLFTLILTAPPTNQQTNVVLHVLPSMVMFEESFSVCML